MKKYVFFLILLISINEISSRKLVFVQNLFRHGARYPIFLTKDDYTMQPDISMNAGELTKQGKNMHYILGKILYKKYWAQLFNETSAFDKYDHNQIYVRSTNVNRTIESVESQLRGWFENVPSLKLNKQNKPYSLPAFEDLQQFVDLNYTNGDKWNVFNELQKYQSIPIHVGLGGEGISSSNPFDQGDFLIKFDKLNCPKQDEWVEQNYNSEMSKYIQNLPQVKQAMRKLEEAFPSVKVTFQNAYKYVDNYQCMKYLSEPVLPIFQDPKYAQTFKYIKEVSLFLSLYYQPIQYQTTSSGLFEQTVNNIKKAISGNGPKLVIYSAHDTTVALMLATFNLTNVDCINQYYLESVQNYQRCVSDYPKFSSNFIIEVYKQDNGKYTMDLVFNNIQRKIPFCGGRKSCQVNQFYKWYEGWYVTNPNKVCGIEDEFEVQMQRLQTNQVRLYSVIAILAIIALLLIIWIWKLKRDQIKKAKQKQGYMDQFEQKQVANKNHEMVGSKQ